MTKKKKIKKRKGLMKKKKKKIKRFRNIEDKERNNGKITSNIKKN